MSEVHDWVWFTSAKGTVGIVKMETEDEGVIYRISAVDGFMEKMDVQQIVAWGARFPQAAGEALFAPRSKKDE
jgi:hypothetical protein